jgi:hypothetical protein
MVRRDEGGRLFLNPGETSGWTFRRPTIALLETSDRSVQIVELLSADLPAVALVPSTGEVVNPPPA